ncbi:hypothetical protein HDU76_007045 [Blyttiomyces sp. JEL0837]|nr:hypothetical protein HDU76_007045 [Blyttiomyces sp. JEL0837]
MKFLGSTLVAGITSLLASYVSATPLGRRTLAPLRVQLESGTFTGKLVTPFNDSSIQIRAHLGIPFAQPPVGSLRFKQAQPVTTYLGERDATELGPACFTNADPKKGLVMSEDCLQLNVWTPADVQEDDRLPVLVWIYGGSFTSGSTRGPVYNGGNLVHGSLDKHRVIVVSFNYRLGPFGFMASKEIEAEGGLNAGLLDQRLAFEWVKNNIKKFGGDPNRITAFGESAGAISIGTHLTAIQPASNPFPFHAAILESGAGSSGIRLSVNAIESTIYKSTLSNTNCTNLSCLRQIPALNLTQAGFTALQSSAGVSYGPIIDGVYVVENPADALKAGKGLKVPLLLGTNTDEGTLFTANVKTEQIYNGYLSKLAPFLPEEKIAEIYTHYPASDYNNSYPFAAAAIFGDFIFQCPVRLLADSYANQGLPVYKYHFNHPHGQYLISGPGTEGFGIAHASELIYVFNDKYLYGNDEERELARNMVGYWTHFARRGAPNFAGSLKHWEKYVIGGEVGKGGGKQLRMDFAGKGGFVTEVDDGIVEKCQPWYEVQRLGCKSLA